MANLSGGNSNSAYDQTTFGGNANSTYDQTIFGGNANSTYDQIPLTLVQLMNMKLNGNECWSEFNKKHKYYTFLEEFSKIKSFYQPSDVPIEPTPADNPTLDC